MFLAKYIHVIAHIFQLNTLYYAGFSTVDFQYSENINDSIVYARVISAEKTTLEK